MHRRINYRKPLLTLMFCVGVFCLSVAGPGGASTFPPSITVLPQNPTVVDSIILRHDFMYSTSGHALRHAEVSMAGPSQFRVDLYVAGPNPGEIVLTVIVPDRYDAALGKLAAGDYSYTSRLVTVPRSLFPVDPDASLFSLYPSSTRQGQFTVTGRSADLDLDGDIDDSDFSLAFAAFTGPDNGPSININADLDGDGDVDDADFGYAFAAFTGPGGGAVVPEPATLSLLMLGGLLAARRRRA